MHPKYVGGNPYAALAPYVGVSEASRGLISQGHGYMGAATIPQMPSLDMPSPFANGYGIMPGLHPLAGLHPSLAQNPLLQQLVQRQAAAHYPHMVASQPARKSGNSLGVNVDAGINNGTFGGTTNGYTISNFPAAGVAISATQTLQSEFHGLKLSASAVYSAFYTASGGGATILYASQSGGVASDVLLQGVFVGGFNAQPLPPGTAITDGGVSLAGFPPNGLGNGIDMLPGKIGQVVKCPLLLQPSIFSIFTVPSGGTGLTITGARIFLTFFGDNLQ